MSDILDNKSDAEIEEIYSRATMEDLQSMLTQEKCLNRRRLLRKVMRVKSSNIPEISDLHKHTEKTIINQQSQQNDIIKTSKIDQNKSDPVKIDNQFIPKKLDEMRKQLHDTVDLTKRKELRKEIQELENSQGTQQKTIHADSRNRKEDLSKETEDQKPPPKKINEENETKFNIIKVIDSNEKTSNKEFPPTQNSSKELPNKEKSNKISTTSSNQNYFNKTLDKTHAEISINDNPPVSQQGNDDRKAQQNVSTAKVYSSSQKEIILDKVSPVQTISDSINNTIPTRNLSLSENKPQRSSANMDYKPITGSNTTYSPSPKPNPNQTNPGSSTTAHAKTNISRVSSVREKFENPPMITTNTFKKPTASSSSSSQSSKMTEKEINDLVNAVLNPEKSNCSVDNKLTVPNQPSRKISQPHEETIHITTSTSKIGKTSKSSLKDLLLMWIEKNTKEYQNVSITNYSRSWADGLAFCALIHHFYPDSFDYKTLSSNNPVANFTLAFDTAKKFAGIEPLIDPEDMITLESPDEKCVYTYVQFMYNALKSHPRNMVKYATNSEG